MVRKKERKLKNPIAKALKFFTSKRFRDKTKYTRKVKNVPIHKKELKFLHGCGYMQTASQLI